MGSLECLCPFLCAGFQNVSYSLQGFVLNCQNLFFKVAQNSLKRHWLTFFQLSVLRIRRRRRRKGGCELKLFWLGRRLKILANIWKWQLQLKKIESSFSCRQTASRSCIWDTKLSKLHSLTLSSHTDRYHITTASNVSASLQPRV